MEGAARDDGQTGGYLLVRAWVEQGAVPPMRARVTSRLDVRSLEEQLLLSADPEEVVAHVRAWLTAFVQLGR